ncbi:hypothetical protein ACOCJ4_13495 [Knoellia sp. CPCC 206435]|uniref:hypothetical protein n=1 Tax=Knoellia terrae TaxID=3404797 RepID=UPI003B433EFB
MEAIMSMSRSILSLAVVPAALLLPLTPANADPTKATFYEAFEVVCDSLGDVTLYGPAATEGAVLKVQGTQLSLVLRKVTITQTDTATGEVLSQIVTLDKVGAPIDDTCSFSFDEDGVTTTVAGGFLLRGPAAG